MQTTFQIPARFFQEAPVRIADDYWRRCHRVLRMVGILHGKGFHGLRIFPYMYPLGYRLELYPASLAGSDGVKLQPALLGGADDGLIARHTGANEAKFFGWEGVENYDAHKLALMFIRRFPRICREAYCLDYPYAGWFATLLAQCDYGFLPYLFSEDEGEVGVLHMYKVREPGLEYFPLPPSPSFGQTFAPDTMAF